MISIAIIESGCSSDMQLFFLAGLLIVDFFIETWIDAKCIRYVLANCCKEMVCIKKKKRYML